MPSDTQSTGSEPSPRTTATDDAAAASAAVTADVVADDERSPINQSSVSLSRVKKTTGIWM